jgi:hypothetical protein
VTGKTSAAQGARTPEDPQPEAAEAPLVADIRI